MFSVIDSLIKSIFHEEIVGNEFRNNFCEWLKKYLEHKISDWAYHTENEIDFNVNVWRNNNCFRVQINYFGTYSKATDPRYDYALTISENIILAYREM